MVDLEGRVSKLTEQNRQLETRRHMDMEGFTADITNLRKMLAATDRKLHEMRLVQRWVAEPWRGEGRGRLGGERAVEMRGRSIYPLSP